jgi:pimeloyl-ACP methyl ester carboxylesterase
MKNLLYILLFVPLALFGQEVNNYPVKKVSYKLSDKLILPKNSNHNFITDSIKQYYQKIEEDAGLISKYDVDKESDELSLGSLLDYYIPYPILFVHGLNGDSQTWLEMTEWLSPALGETVKLDFCLNADGSIFSSTMSSDVVSFIPNNLSNSNLYKITFNCNSIGDCYYGAPTNNNGLYYSNQSAIAKQGKAIGIAVEAILESTGASRIILVGHSMGGLAIREYMQNSIYWPESIFSHGIAKLITVGTPHEGCDFELQGFSSLFPSDIDDFGEAIRDLRSCYDIFGTGVTSGVFLWGGTESQSYMYDNLLYDWNNVDVNCNGTIYESLIGLNQKGIYNNIEYASIMDVSDLMVAPANVGYGWNNSSTYGGENFCGVLDLGWSNSEERHCESWGFDAIGGLSGGHSELPNYTTQNLWALDEPDDFNRAFEVHFDKNYAGFITPQAENAPYTNDYDDYIVYIPTDGILTLSASFLDGSEGDAVYLYDMNAEDYINGVQNVSENEDMSTIVSEGYYIVEFEGLETEEESFSQYFFSLNFDAYNDGLGVDGITYDSPILIKMIDVLGREQKEHKKGTLLFYIYDNGLVEKRVTH